MRTSMGRWLSLFATLVLTACSTTPRGPLNWTAWQARRTESIGGTNGWTTLIGLHWLKEGPNSVGGDPTNQVVIASVRAPADLGTFTRAGTSVWFEAHADVRVNGQKITKLELISDASPKPTKLQVGSLSVIAIKRGERMGLRVRDSESKERSRVSGLRWFPYDPAWRFEGRFEPFELSKRLRTPDVTGATQEFVNPGAIVFTALGKEYRLDVALEPDEPDYFIMFHDQTAGISTYGSGRFLYVAKPDPQGRVVIDFNRAYTPPCGFTDFATCPLPPRQNWLALEVKAGELKPHGSHH